MRGFWFQCHFAVVEQLPIVREDALHSLTVSHNCVDKKTCRAPCLAWQSATSDELLVGSPPASFLSSLSGPSSSSQGTLDSWAASGPGLPTVFPQPAGPLEHAAPTLHLLSPERRLKPSPLGLSTRNLNALAYATVLFALMPASPSISADVGSSYIAVRSRALITPCIGAHWTVKCHASNLHFVCLFGKTRTSFAP